MKRSAEDFAEYGMTESMTARHDHDGPSRGLSYLPSRVMKREAEEFAMYKMTDSMTARLDHDGPS